MGMFVLMGMGLGAGIGAIYGFFDSEGAKTIDERGGEIFMSAFGGAMVGLLVSGAIVGCGN